MLGFVAVQVFLISGLGWCLESVRDEIVSEGDVILHGLHLALKSLGNFLGKHSDKTQYRYTNKCLYSVYCAVVLFSYFILSLTVHHKASRLSTSIY